MLQGRPDLMNQLAKQAKDLNKSVDKNPDLSDVFGLRMYFLNKEQVQFRLHCQMCQSLAQDPNLAVDFQEHKQAHFELGPVDSNKAEIDKVFTNKK